MLNFQGNQTNEVHKKMLINEWTFFVLLPSKSEALMLWSNIESRLMGQKEWTKRLVCKSPSAKTVMFFFIEVLPVNWLQSMGFTCWITHTHTRVYHLCDTKKATSWIIPKTHHYESLRMMEYNEHKTLLYCCMWARECVCARLCVCIVRCKCM